MHVAQMEVVRLNPTITLANNGKVFILNTTELAQTVLSTTIGPWRGQFLNWRLIIPYFLVGNQAVTLALEELVNGAWVAARTPPTGFSGGNNALAASTTYDGFSWLLYNEMNIYITQGATAPNALAFGAPYLVNDPNKGT